MKKIIIACLVLSGCAASFQVGQTKSDISRAEIATAFQQRDQVIADLVKQIKPIVDSWVKK